MCLSGSEGWPAPESGSPVSPGAASPRNDAARQRLAKALRANLGRRKAQKIDRAKQAEDEAKSKPAQGESANGAGKKQD